MSILNMLMEKKDLKTYIIYRTEFLQQERDDEIQKQPESERGFIQERFKGRLLELKKLKESLERDQIRNDAKKYYKKMRQ